MYTDELIEVGCFIDRAAFNSLHVRIKYHNKTNRVLKIGAHYMIPENSFRVIGNDKINKRLFDEMMKRQREIQVKLLESAKAEREQDEETRRESERAKNVKPDMPLELKQYLENKRQNESQIQRTPVGLTPFFKSLSEKYFQMIK